MVQVSMTTYLMFNQFYSACTPIIRASDPMFHFRRRQLYFIRISSQSSLEHLIAYRLKAAILQHCLCYSIYVPSTVRLSCLILN
jgi:hypothetical protein